MASNKLILGLAVATSLAFKPSPADFLTAAGLKLFLTILFAGYTLLTIYNIYIYPYYVSPLRHIPGPKNTSPLLGHLPLQLTSPSPNEPFLTWMRTFSSPSSSHPSNKPPPPLIRYFAPLGSEALLINSLEVINEVFIKHPYAFVKPQALRRLIMPVVGTGLLFTEGQEDHLGLRKKMGRPFSIGNLKRLVGVFKGKAGELAGVVGGLVDGGMKGGEGGGDGDGKGEGVVVDVASEYISATLDIIGVAALGVELHNLESKTSFKECFNRIFDPSTLSLVLWAISSLVPIRWLPLEENRRFEEATTTMHRLTREIIRDRIRDMQAEEDGEKEKVERQDLLTFMLEEDIGSGQVKWSEGDLLGHMMNFLAAGHETTATSLTWSTHAMAIHPQLQEDLRKEIQDMLKHHPDPGYSEIESLKLLANFCKEIFRFYAPSLSIPRTTTHPIIIANTLIPAGTTLNLMPFIIHRNPATWGPDADKFNPQRWDHSASREGASDPLALATFSLGPRVCIGRMFGIIEMKVILVEMISKFRFVKMEGVNGDEDVELANPNPILRPKGGLKARVLRV